MELKEQFDRVSAKYDTQRRAFIPCFDHFYGVAAENLNLDGETPRILDLGAGTGIFSGFILERYPAAEMTLVDLSEGMLSVARERFAGIGSVEYRTADISVFPIGRQQYDGVISSLAIHHLPDPEKRTLYRRIYDGLKPGGIFLNADQVLADTPELEEIYSREWKRKVERSSLSPEEIAAGYERQKLDIRTPLGTQMRWLAEAGFSAADCLYKYYDFVVMWAKK